MLNSDPIESETIEASHSVELVGQQAHGFHRITLSQDLRKTRQPWHTPSTSDDEHDDGEDALNTDIDIWTVASGYKHSCKQQCFDGFDH